VNQPEGNYEHSERAHLRQGVSGCDPESLSGVRMWMTSNISRNLPYPKIHLCKHLHENLITFFTDMSQIWNMSDFAMLKNSLENSSIRI